MSTKSIRPAASSSSSSSLTSSLPSLTSIRQNTLSSISTLTTNYSSTTPPRIKLIDSFLLFLMLGGIAQFGYCALISSFPYNAFLAGFAGTIGQFVLLASLRSQVVPETRDVEFKHVSEERAFADFCAASVVLHLFMYNFLG